MSDKDIGETSDGYHTFNELYEHRISLFVALMLSHKELSWIAHKHDDGSFYDGWVLAGMDLPTGTITYHLPDIRLQSFDGKGVRILSRAPEWDGHDSMDVIERLNDWAATLKIMSDKDTRIKIPIGADRVVNAATGEVKELVLARKSLEDLIDYIESEGWGWDVGVLSGYGYEARIWDWPNVIGRFRSDKRLTVRQMIENAIEDINNERKAAQEIRPV